MIAAALTAGAAPLPIEGLWRAQSGGGVIELHRCGEALCGRVAESEDISANPDLRDIHNKRADLRDRKMKDLDLFYGFKGGPTRWTGGQIYDPDDGRIYHGSIELLPSDRVKVVGCLVAPLCGGQVWTRAP